MSQSMKIAFVSDDGRTISQHFGRARYYVVVTVEDGQPIAWETRPRTLPHAQGHGHHHGHSGHHDHDSPSAGHGMGPQAAERHAAMLEQLRDCQVLIAGGMGMGAYQNMSEAGLEVIATNMRSIEDAVRAYLDGTLVHQERRVH